MYKNYFLTYNIFSINVNITIEQNVQNNGVFDYYDSATTRNNEAITYIFVTIYFNIILQLKKKFSIHNMNMFFQYIFLYDVQFLCI